jgi:hypothetical protein
LKGYIQRILRHNLNQAAQQRQALFVVLVAVKSAPFRLIGNPRLMQSKIARVEHNKAGRGSAAAPGHMIHRTAE